MAKQPAFEDTAEPIVGIGGALAPHDLYITPELRRRAPRVTDYLKEKLALQDIAAQMLDHPERVLPKLVDRAMEMAGAKSAGISVLEERAGTAGGFRWRDLRGELAGFEGGATPRNYSPCGVCLDRCEVILCRRPERYYRWLAERGLSFPELLVAPLYVAHERPIGTLWIISEREEYFDSGHARILEELASFTGMALAMLRDQQRLLDAARRQEMLTGEMSHRVKNLFSVVDALVHASKRSATSASEMADALSGRLHALAAAHALVRESLHTDADEPPRPTISLKELVLAVLKPYEDGRAERFIVEGLEIDLGAHVATGLALVFHELATNAAKYGALTRDRGRVSVTWRREREALVLRWQESGGPAIAVAPTRRGFGGDLVRDTVQRQFGGRLTLDWQEQGLVTELTTPLARLAY